MYLTENMLSSGRIVSHQIWGPYAYFFQPPIDNIHTLLPKVMCKYVYILYNYSEDSDICQMGEQVFQSFRRRKMPLVRWAWTLFWSPSLVWKLWPPQQFPNSEKTFQSFNTVAQQLLGKLKPNWLQSTWT